MAETVRKAPPEFRFFALEVLSPMRGKGHVSRIPHAFAQKRARDEWAAREAQADRHHGVVRERRACTRSDAEACLVDDAGVGMVLHRFADRPRGRKVSSAAVAAARTALRGMDAGALRRLAAEHGLETVEGGRSLGKSALSSRLIAIDEVVLALASGA